MYAAEYRFYSIQKHAYASEYMFDYIHRHTCHSEYRFFGSQRHTHERRVRCFRKKNGLIWMCVIESFIRDVVAIDSLNICNRRLFHQVNARASHCWHPMNMVSVPSTRAWGNVLIYITFIAEAEIVTDGKSDL